eukprot:TRINITY_DN47429_c0_g1_i4.p1 TRINITY_DN47429_c0_g1~~TRINITY_DN47429_c0_g1_i4.p1  ORF type:complete len:182 (+),score=41.11 TRINITY_DN47429_c0_g1_i4:28-546(+)
MEILSEEDHSHLEVSQFGNLYASSSLAKTNDTETKELETPKTETTVDKSKSQHVGMFRQYALVQYRHFQSHYRNLELNKKRLDLLTFMGILFGLLYLQLPTDDFSGIFSKLSFIVTSSAFNGIIFSATALSVVARERAVFYREQSTQMYSPFEIGRAVQQECRDRSRMPSSA